VMAAKLILASGKWGNESLVVKNQKALLQSEVLGDILASNFPMRRLWRSFGQSCARKAQLPILALEALIRSQTTRRKTPWGYKPLVHTFEVRMRWALPSE
jgi:hypothetical protein